MLDSFVTTKIRPIRKIFIIDENDIQTFFLIFNVLMKEIDGILNLILPVNEHLSSSRNKEFANRFDPDVILNYSKLDDVIISEYFNATVFNSSSQNYNVHKFGSPIFTFTNTPYLATKDPTLIPRKVYASSKIEFTPNSLLLALNYGVLDKRNYVDLKRMPSIFQEVTVSCVNELPDIKNNLFDNKIKYHNLTNEIGNAYSSSSIYDINYNSQRYFTQKDTEYIFISQPQDLNFILYFWNTRSTYSSAHLAWIPIDFIEQLIDIINEKTTIVIPSDEYKGKIINLFPNNNYILADRYYFEGEKERWINFEHDQYLTTTSQEKLLTHPNEKTFSDIGFGGGFAFEIRGPSEFLYPKKHFIGQEFCERKINSITFPEYFTRLSNKGLSIYFSHFSPYETSGVTQSFRLPTFENLLKSHFKYFNFVIKQTPKTYILEQLIKIMGGVSNSHLICEERVFNLLISLTPHTRTKQLIQKVLPEVENHSSQDELMAYIGTLKERGEISLSSTVITMDKIINKLELKLEHRANFLPKLQDLYDKKILLRGKNFKCEHCSAMLWFPLDSFQRTNHCVECGNEVNIPIFIDGVIQSDHYKLNQLVARAIDQGQLSTLLLINYIYKQRYNRFKYESNYEIFENDRLISDIDLFVKISNKLGLCECKSNSPFSEKQIDELINTAQTIGCDFIILSCLLDSTDIKIEGTVHYLKSKKLNIPVLIVTKSELFNNDPQRIFKYFEVDRRTSEHFKGPIVIGGSNYN
ncbi:hypothetical protein OP862_05625 [Yersinia massiliensis]|uniref:Uncharacterized protein n=2 Tax=Yersinia TaxID=629 RepID=A0AA90YAK8_9GAMM|nr:hypothetical protein [Yersinia massiliensis]MDA5549393.1 hypothetical protein [Yersinia massiliensis]NIL27536.1 hypothetical protein [Yersinia massiliensis]UZM80139.1 hypothetical protein OP862_05625 [Yersinia massiliensis]